MIIVMECCTGGELKDLVDEGSLDELRTRDIIGQIISGIR
jgi:serine/threonine protein kinase